MVIEALSKAKVFESLVSKNGLDTQVGDNGVLLSGGQKQRIALARALYLNPRILVFDEPTSALDIETEKEFINEIFQIAGNLTVFIVTHRPETVARCDTVYSVSNGTILAV